jgi:heme-degrading monooxygenase HmoA
MKAIISTTFPGATFIQLWRMESLEQQATWLQTMHSRIHLLQSKPGFVSMALHPSLDGRNVVVYAQWESPDDLKRGASDPEVRAAREQLDALGSPDGTRFVVYSVHQPPELASG